MSSSAIGKHCLFKGFVLPISKVKDHTVLGFSLAAEAGFEAASGMLFGQIQEFARTARVRVTGGYPYFLRMRFTKIRIRAGALSRLCQSTLSVTAISKIE